MSTFELTLVTLPVNTYHFVGACNATFTTESSGDEFRSLLNKFRMSGGG